MNRQLLLLRRVPLLRLNHVNKHLPFPSFFLPLESECQVKASSFYALRHFHGTLLANGVASKLNEAQSDVSEEIVDQSRKQEDKIEKSRKQEDNVDTSKPADYNPSTFDPSESRSIPSEKILQIVDEIANLTLLEASDLSYLLKKKLGLPDSAMPYYGGMGGGQGAGGSTSSSTAEEEEKKPEKTNFDIRLEKFDASAKIKVIKEVRTFTSLGLKEAKELVEKLPAILKKGVLKEEADQIIEKLKAIGASAVLE